MVAIENASMQYQLTAEAQELGATGGRLSAIADITPRIDKLLMRYQFAARQTAGNPNLCVHVPTNRDQLFSWWERGLGEAFCYNGDGEIREVYGEIFQSGATERSGIALWESLAFHVLAARNSPEITIKKIEISFGEDFFDSFLRQTIPTFQGEMFVEKSVIACKNTIQEKLWPIRKFKQKYTVIDRDLFFSLAANQFLIEEADPTDFAIHPNQMYVKDRQILWPYSVEKILSKLEKVGCFEEGDRETLFPLFIHIGERLFQDTDKFAFRNYLLGIVERINGTEGVDYARRVLDDFDKLYFPPTDEERSSFRTHWMFSSEMEVVRGKIDEAKAALDEKYKEITYPLRPALITTETLRVAKKNPSSFWTCVFDREIRPTMERLFTGEQAAPFRPIYEGALRENLLHPVMLLMFTHMFGLDEYQARSLVAINFMAWGAVKGLDEIVDDEQIRKGVPTPLATSGLSDALEASLLAFGDVLGKTFHDRALGAAFVNVLTATCRADMEARQFSWDTPVAEQIRIMEQINLAGSWFPSYLGDRMGLPEVGRYLAAFNRFHTILIELAGDVRDIAPVNITAESGRDYGTKLTLPLQILVEVAQKEDATFIRTFFDQERIRKRNRLPEQKNTAKNRMKVLQIGQTYRGVVIARLAPIVASLHGQAERSLMLGFARLPIMDEANNQYKEVFERFLEPFRNSKIPDTLM